MQVKSDDEDDFPAASQSMSARNFRTSADDWVEAIYLCNVSRRIKTIAKDLIGLPDSGFVYDQHAHELAF